MEPLTHEQACTQLARVCLAYTAGAIDRDDWYRRVAAVFERLHYDARVPAPELAGASR